MYLVNRMPTGNSQLTTPWFSPHRLDRPGVDQGRGNAAEVNTPLERIGTPISNARDESRCGESLAVSHDARFPKGGSPFTSR